jgi:hypothetical protein
MSDLPVSVFSFQKQSDEKNILIQEAGSERSVGKIT